MPNYTVELWPKNSAFLQLQDTPLQLGHGDTRKRKLPVSSKKYVCVLYEMKVVMEVPLTVWCRIPKNFQLGMLFLHVSKFINKKRVVGE